MLKEANGDTWSQTMVDGVDARRLPRRPQREISLWLIGSKTGADGQPLLLATEVSERGRNLVADRELEGGGPARPAGRAGEREVPARGTRFAQNWLMGNLGPFLSLARR